MRILIVGAGCVGQVYGFHLARAGAQITFLIKPPHREWAEGGFTLFALNGRKRAEPILWKDYTLVDAAAAAAGPFDQVWLSVPADALSGAWLDTLAALHPQAVWVNLTPGPVAHKRMCALVPEAQVVTGMISLIAYEAPLPGETRFPSPGTAFWFPPLGPSPFSGARAPEVVAALKKGGQPARVVRSSPSGQAFPTALLMPILLALEANGWSFARLRVGQGLRLAVDAGQEALGITAHQTGLPVPWLLRQVRPWMLAAVSHLAVWVIPMDIEVYLRVHFTKVRPQTMLFVQRYLQIADEPGLPAVKLRRLLAMVAPELA